MFLYNISIRTFGFGIGLAALFNRKARLLYRGHKGLMRSVEKKTASFGEGTKRIWIHCASLGEFEQGRPLIEALRRKYPKADGGGDSSRAIIVTFFSSSGYEVRKDYELADAVFYLPADTPGNARKFIRAVQPEIAVFVKYEYWYNYLNELDQRGIPSYVISAIFRPDMIFFKHTAMGGFMRKTLGLLKHFFVQNEASKQLLENIGIGGERVTISGDTRFDRVTELAKNAPKLPLVEAFARDGWVMVCGSTWPRDEELILELMKTPVGEGIKVVIAPHEIHEERIQKLIEQSGRKDKTVRYAEIKELPEEKGMRLAGKATLLIVDTMGVLSGVYRFGKVAYIGGGFGRGIHNILEAATWGMPVLFGPNCQAFAEAVQLIELGAAQAVKNSEELKRGVGMLKSDDALCAVKGATAESYVRGRAGATGIILSKIAATEAKK